MEGKNIPEELKKLEAKIAKMKAGPGTSSKISRYYTVTGTGFRLAVDLLAGIVVGGGLGMVLDWVFDLKPIMLVIFLLLGGAAGFLNVYRSAHNIEEKHE